MLQSQRAGFGIGKVPVIFAQIRRDLILVFFQLRADVFETGQGIDHIDAEISGDGILQIRGDKGLHENGVIAVRVVDDPLVLKSQQAVVAHQGPDLVSGDQGHFSRTIARRHGHAVAVGVGGDDQVCATFFGLGDSHAEGFRILRIG